MNEAYASLLKVFSGSRDLVQGVEAQLRKRQRLGVGGLLTSLAGLVVGVAGLMADGKLNAAVGDFGKTIRGIADGTTPGATLVVLIGTVLLAGGAVLYVLLRWTRFLQAESQEPFRYTVSIQPFARAAAKAPGCTLAQESRLALLHHDLRERLNQRIGRFSLLDAPPAAAEAGAALPHIHVAGEYALREDRRGYWFLQVMPTVRLGSARSPLAMAYTVMFEIGRLGDTRLTVLRYEQIVERVYSSVATEIYRTIEADVRAKIARFPTRYLRAVALYYEARDIARSNTVDAYDLALDLYRDARRCFDMAPWREGRRWWVNVPLLWRGAMHRLQMRARVHTGHVQCQLYRYMTALQTGRRPNPIFECIWRMNEVIADLKQVHARVIDGDARELDNPRAVRGFFRFRRDRYARWLLRRPLEAEFAQLRRALFDAHTMAALAHQLLGATHEARVHLDAAAAADPTLPGRDPVYMVAKAEIEPTLTLRARLLRSATELAPKFQIAQYRLANTIEHLFRQDGELSDGRLRSVMEQYDEVLRINPGNLAAIAAQGYLLWLVGKLPDAEQRFREGLEFKTIVRDTATAELNYGLARVLAETDHDEEAYDQYAQSIAADRNVAAWTIGAGSRLTGNYYVFIEPAVVQRYQDYCDTVERRMLALAGSTGLTPVRRIIRSFVWNDLANACLNGWFRSGDPVLLDRAFEALRSALDASRTNAMAHFNLAHAHSYIALSAPGPRVAEELAAIGEAVKLAPNWVAARQREAQLSLSTQTLDALESEVQRQREKLQGLEAKARAAHDALVHASARAVPAGLSMTADSFQASSGPAAASDRLDVEVARARQQLRKLDENHADARNHYDKRVDDAIDHLTLASRLRELLRPPADGHGAQRWCDNTLALMRDSRMRWDLLDEADVMALRSIADATTKRAIHRLSLADRVLGAANVDAAHSAKLDAERGRLVEDLRRNHELVRSLEASFFGTDLDLPLTRLDIMDALHEDREPDALKTIEDAASSWACEDPTHYWVLKNWIAWLDRERGIELVELAERLLRSRLRDPRRLGLVVERLLKSAAGDGQAERRAACMKALAQICADEAPTEMQYQFLLAQVLGRAPFDEQDWAGAVAALDRALACVAESAAVTRRQVTDWREQVFTQRIDECARRSEHERAYELAAQVVRFDPQGAASALRLVARSEAFGSRAERAGHAQQALALLGEVGSAALHGRVVSLLRALQVYDLRAAQPQLELTPIGVDIASDLIDLVALGEAGLQPELEREIALLRDAMRASHGVVLPGVRFYGKNSGELPRGVYILKLQQLPVDAGALHVGRVFRVPADAASLGNAVEAVADPLSGRRGAWVAASSAGRGNGAALEQFGPIEMLMRHLRALLGRHLAALFSEYEFSDLLNTLPRAARRSIDADERTLLHTALRALLSEGVPVVAIAEIVAAWPALRASAPHLGAVVEALRKLPGIVGSLPGNDGRHTLLRVGAHIEAALREGLRGAPEPVLALDPATLQDILAVVRAAVPPDAATHPAALVTDDAPLRPHLVRLMRLEFPVLPVLAGAELAPIDAVRCLTIDVEGAP